MKKMAKYIKYYCFGGIFCCQSCCFLAVLSTFNMRTVSVGQNESILRLLLFAQRRSRKTCRLVRPFREATYPESVFEILLLLSLLPVQSPG